MNTPPAAEVSTDRRSPRSPHIFKRFDDTDANLRVGPLDRRSTDDVMRLLPTLPGWDGRRGRRLERLIGARQILDWLSTFEGDGWQARWTAAGCDEGVDWLNDVIGACVALGDQRALSTMRGQLTGGLRYLLVARTTLPSYDFLMAYKAQRLFLLVQDVHRPDLWAKVTANSQNLGLGPERRREGAVILAKLVLHTGKDLDALTAEDLFRYRTWISRRHPHSGHSRPDLAWRLLEGIADLGEHTSLRNALRLGQRSAAELVDAYDIQCKPIRDVFVRYLNERRPSLDYNSFKNVATNLVGNFWADIEAHHSGLDNLHLSADVADAWKRRLQVIVERDGTTRPRRSYLELLLQVRGFYLDIQEWATEDSSWAQWAVPSPVRRGETDGMMKAKKRTRAQMHQRVRDRLPHLHKLVDSADRHRDEQASLLAAAQATLIGNSFVHQGRTYLRCAPSRTSRRPLTVKIDDLTTGERTNVTQAEDEAFWSWAVIEVLRHTGVRVEELTEITHCALVQYTMPKTNELVPMLQVVPSKSNAERLLMLSPEATSVLATIISRLRQQNDGAVPLTPRYDPYERTIGAPLPYLFQRRQGWRWEVPSYNTVNKLLKGAIFRAGLQDAAGNPLHYTPHDFRRMFATEAVTEGLPVHIVARLLGHANINTTQAYMAVFDNELIMNYRSFLERRRAIRPSDEYREPTDDEWREFQQHFEARKLALGECGRPYGTDCKHEHACIRCPSLRVDPRERRRLIAIIENLKDRIREAQSNGWTGEVNGLTVTHAAAVNKLVGLDRSQNRPPMGTIDLGITPIIH